MAGDDAVVMVDNTCTSPPEKRAMTYRYGRDWHPVLRKPIQEISEAQARKRFTDGPSFSVSSVTDPSGGVVPGYTLKINPDGMYVGTVFYDQFGSQVKHYHFYEQEDRPDELFLSGLTVHVYPDDQTKWLSLRDSKAHTTFTFKPNGWARSYLAVKGEPAAKVEEFTGVDVSAHWVPMITFGDWDRFGEHREPALPG